MDLEHVYTHGPYPTLGPRPQLARLAYQHVPALPSFLLETTYENEHTSPSGRAARARARVTECR